jgi:hydrogenase maturation factor
MDPLGTIASGALLLTIAPSDLPALERSFQKASIPIRVIGRVKKGKPRVFAVDRKGKKEVKPFARDEILKIYKNA